MRWPWTAQLRWWEYQRDVLPGVKRDLDAATRKAAEARACRHPHEWTEPDDNGERGHSFYCWCGWSILCVECATTLYTCLQRARGNCCDRCEHPRESLDPWFDYCPTCKGRYSDPAAHPHADRGCDETPSANPGCLDQRGDAEWSCIESDGTGLWCDSCKALDSQ
jgi:hypothetical protein